MLAVKTYDNNLSYQELKDDIQLLEEQLKILIGENSHFDEDERSQVNHENFERDLVTTQVASVQRSTPTNKSRGSSHCIG